LLKEVSLCSLNRRLFSLPVILGFALISCSVEKHSLPVASHVPTRIILGWTGDPARTQAVTWMTEEPVSFPQAQFAVATPNPDFQRSAVTVAAGTIPFPPVAEIRARHYRAVFEGLKPNTRYVYRVGDGNTWSEWIDFRTADDLEKAFRFLYVGDAQNSIKSLWSRSIRAAYSAAPDARFIVYAGDVLAEGYDDQLWGEWWYGMNFIAAMIPNLPVPGNHDLHRNPGSPDADQVLSVSSLWNAHFSVPSNGPGTPLDHQSYYFDYQGVRFIFIDVNVFANEDFEPAEKDRVSKMQAGWLEETLKCNPNEWTIVVQHQPIFAVAKKRNYAAMRALLEPIYDRYHVDLVLEGHDHVYARTHKIFEGRVVEDSEPGSIYVTSVSGPKMYTLDDPFNPLMSKTRMNTQMYQIVSIDKEILDFQAFAIDGTLVDRYRLDKSADHSKLIECNRQALPERLSKISAEHDCGTQ
jgi:3',5'-cyclic AMP phosphodiesterase CpdA